MINAVFTEKMRKLLQNLVGKELRFYECQKNRTANRIFGNFRIYYDASALEISNEEKVFPFFDSEEDMTCFACHEVLTSEPFQPVVLGEVEKIYVGDRIQAIEIIQDDITVSEDQYHVVFDAALVIRMAHKTLMFARDAWFSQVITIVENDDYDHIYPVENVIDTWSNDGEYQVAVKRTRQVLKSI